MKSPSLARSARAVAVVLLALAAGACASAGGAVPRPFPMPAAPPPAAAVPPPGPGGATVEPVETARIEEPVLQVAPLSAAGSASAVLATALALRGVPYRNGGSDLSGFDCSGFTQYVFAQHALILPREVKDQWDAGKKVSARSLRAGDLLFFATTSRKASHVGIALDNDTFVHAPSSNGAVRIERLSADYWKSRFLGVRRILQ